MNMGSASFSPLPRRTWSMAALVAVLMLASVLFPAMALAQEHPELQIHSTNYIVVNADTGEIVSVDFGSNGPAVCKSASAK